MKALGSTLLGTGFLCGAFVAVREAEQVSWTPFAICAAAMLLGLVLVRMTLADERADARVVDDVAELGRSLERLLVSLRSILAEREQIDVYDVHGMIDAQLSEDLAVFVELRESMIAHFGMQPYADVMSAFAGGERVINRAWSASADGYIDEVWRSLELAEGELAHAREMLFAARRD